MRAPSDAAEPGDAARRARHRGRVRDLGDRGHRPPGRLPRRRPDPARGDPARGLSRRHRPRDHGVVALAAARQGARRGTAPAHQPRRRVSRAGRRDRVHHPPIVPRSARWPRRSPASAPRSRCPSCHSGRRRVARCSRRPGRPGPGWWGSTGCPSAIDDLPIDGVLTVFPEGAVGSADGQTLLIRVAARPPAAAARSPGAGRRRAASRTRSCAPTRAARSGLYRAAEQQAHLPLPPVDLRRAAPGRRRPSGRPHDRCRSCRSSWPRTARSWRWATSPSPSGRASGT